MENIPGFVGLNDAYYGVVDKIVEIMAYFHAVAGSIGKVALLLALGLAALNYAISGEGLKSNLIKIAKATFFFLLIWSMYFRLVGWITNWTFAQAIAATYDDTVKTVFTDTKNEIASNAVTPEDEDLVGTFAQQNLNKEEVTDSNPYNYFSKMIISRQKGDITYSVVAPSAVLEVILLSAGECLRFADKALNLGGSGPGGLVKGFLCAFFIIFTGVFGTVEYLIAYLEFMLIAGVGIILFPLSIWEGTKFMSEKFVGALIGFFVKLLFCNICIFLMIFGFLMLAKGFTVTHFTGNVNQIVYVIFTCLLFFYICKSAPALAQSLLTGTPSLSATGAISAAAGAVTAAAGVGGIAARGTAQGMVGMAGTGAQALGAMQGAKQAGGSVGDVLKAGAGSVASSAGGAVKAGAGELAQSLLGRPIIGGSRGGGGGTSGGGILGKNADGTSRTLGQKIKGDYAAGKAMGTEATAPVVRAREMTAAANARAADGGYTERLAGINQANATEKAEALEAQAERGRVAAASQAHAEEIGSAFASAFDTDGTSPASGGFGKGLDAETRTKVGEVMGRSPWKPTSTQTELDAASKNHAEETASAFADSYKGEK